MAEQAEDEAERQMMREARATRALPKPEPDPDDPRSEWSNWTSGSYVPPSPETAHPEFDPLPAKAGKGPISPRTGRPLRRYRKRQPKPPFTPPDDARKADAVAAAAANRQELANAEAERRRRRKDSGDS